MLDDRLAKLKLVRKGIFPFARGNLDCSLFDVLADQMYGNSMYRRLALADLIAAPPTPATAVDLPIPSVYARYLQSFADAHRCKIEVFVARSDVSEVWSTILFPTRSPMESNMQPLRVACLVSVGPDAETFDHVVFDAVQPYAEFGADFPALALAPLEKKVTELIRKQQNIGVDSENVLLRRGKALADRLATAKLVFVVGTASEGTLLVASIWLM